MILLLMGLFYGWALGAAFMLLFNHEETFALEVLAAALWPLLLAVWLVDMLCDRIIAWWWA